MARELHFKDPAFRSEVILSGAAMALYEAADPQFERLKGIRSLGLAAHVDDGAVHTRHQHLVGLMRIFNKLCQVPKDKGLPKSFLWSFWCRLCFAQTGHAAMSYDAEKAVLLACQLDSNFKATLRALLQPVIDKASACSQCARKSCPDRDKGAGDASLWFDDMVGRNRWRQLHLWIAALKLLREPKLLVILNGQTVNANNPLGFSIPEAIKVLIAPGCEWDAAMTNLTRLDFIVRDLAFAGTLGIQLDVDNLVAAANEPNPDWGLLSHLNTYMAETLYESPAAQTTSALLQRALADLLIRNKVALETLFGFDPATSLSDDDLRNVLARTRGGREVFVDATRTAWRTWVISTYVAPQFVPCEIEKAITGNEEGHLTAHIEARVTCLKLAEDHTLAIAICHKGLADRPEAKSFVKICRSVLGHQYPNLAAQQLTSALFEGLIDRRCEHGLEAAVSCIAQLPVNIETLRGAADTVNSRTLDKSDTEGDFSYKIGGYEYPLRGDLAQPHINMMHAALSGSDEVREALGVSTEDAAGVLWNELTSWQTIYFGAEPTPTIIKALDAAQDLLAMQVVGAGPTAQSDLERYALLEALKHPPGLASFRVSLPNLVLLKEDGTPENEYDVVSVVLKGENDVEVWIWGVTTAADLGPKRTSDLGKIQKLKDLLGARWAGDVRVVTCYVHREGRDICLEIDGIQTRRQVAAA